MKLLIIDDHSFVRKGLLHVLQEELPDEQITADEAASFDSAVALLHDSAQYDLVLLDISLAGRSGLELLTLVKQQYPELPVLVVSMHPVEQYALRTIKLGAAGYLPKHAAPDELSTAVVQIRDYGSYLTPAVAHLLAREYNRSEHAEDKNLHDLLSKRELEVARLVVAGRPIKQIAAQLHISIKTIHTHRSRVLHKLQISRDAELAAYFIHHNLC